MRQLKGRVWHPHHGMRRKTEDEEEEKAAGEAGEEGVTPATTPWTSLSGTTSAGRRSPGRARLTEPGTQRHPFTNLLDQYSRALRATEDRLDALLERFDDLQRLYRLKCAESAGREAAVGALKLELAHARQDVAAAVAGRTEAEERCEASEEAGRRMRASLEEAEGQRLRERRRTAWRHDKASQCDGDEDRGSGGGAFAGTRPRLRAGRAGAADAGTQDYPSPALSELMAQLEEQGSTGGRSTRQRTAHPKVSSASAAAQEAVPATDVSESAAGGGLGSDAGTGVGGEFHAPPSLAPAARGSDRSSSEVAAAAAAAAGSRDARTQGAAPSAGAAASFASSRSAHGAQRQAALDDCNASLAGLLREIAVCRDYVEHSRSASPAAGAESQGRSGRPPRPQASGIGAGTAPPTASPLTPVDLYAAKLNSLERDLLEFYDSAIASQAASNISGGTAGQPQGSGMPPPPHTHP